MTGLLHAVVSQLEFRGRPTTVVVPQTGGSLVLRHAHDIPVHAYRRLYDEVGRPHHWTSRLLPDDVLAREIHADGMSVFVLEFDDEPAGWFELEAKRRPARTRIVHFGIMPRFRGRGLSHYLLFRAIEAALETGAETVTLETNTLDHPAALPLYLAAGFVCVEKRNVVTPAIFDDRAS